MLKVHNQASFNKEIEKLVRIDKMGYLEAISHYMQVTGIEPEAIPKLLTKSLKDLLEAEATNLRLIHRDKNKFDLK
jgi:hypothetical protein